MREGLIQHGQGMEQENDLKTPFFIQICGLTKADYAAARRQPLDFLQRGLSLDEPEQLTITKARPRAKENQRRIVFAAPQETEQRPYSLAKNTCSGSWRTA